VLFYGVSLPSGGQLHLLPSAPDRRIEFVGDSETAGYGNLGPSEPADQPSWLSCLRMDPADQDAMRSWPAFASQQLGADFSLVAWSGIGAIWNAPAGGCSTRRPMREVYPRLIGSDPDSSGGLLESWTPQMVVLYIGGNDWWSLCGSNESQLVQGFVGLLTEIRALRPDTVILILLASADSFCACIDSLEEQARFSADMHRCWMAAVQEFHDEGVRVEMVRPSPMIDLHDPTDWGQCAHWSVQGQAKWARAAAPLIAKHAPWS